MRPFRSDPKVRRLRRLRPFAHASKEQLRHTARALDIVHVDAGTQLLTQGRLGTEFYVVMDGSARVERDGSVIARVHPGDIVGEQALVGPGRRNATVVAETDMILATSTRPYFASLVADVPSFGAQVRHDMDVRTADAA